MVVFVPPVVVGARARLGQDFRYGLKEPLFRPHLDVQHGSIQSSAVLPHDAAVVEQHPLNVAGLPRQIHNLHETKAKMRRDAPLVTIDFPRNPLRSVRVQSPGHFLAGSDEGLFRVRRDERVEILGAALKCGEQVRKKRRVPVDAVARVSSRILQSHVLQLVGVHR